MKMIKFEFMEDLPHTVDMRENIVYISLEDNISKHLCLCGCGELVVTPISPAEWSLIYNGKYSLSPSIGNWQLPCQSHYFIENERIVWSYQFSEPKIKAIQERDKQDLENQIKTTNQAIIKTNRKSIFNLIINRLKKIFTLKN